MGGSTGRIRRGVAAPGWATTVLVAALVWAAPGGAEGTRVASPGASDVHGSVTVDGPCADGLVRDDGSLETAFGWVPSVIDGRYVQEFEQAALVPTRSVAKVCLCLTRTRPDSDIDLVVEVYEAGRLEPGLRPVDRPVVQVPLTATDVPQYPEGAWYEVEIEPAAAVDTRLFYVGARWDASVDQFFFICADESPITPFTEGFFRDEEAWTWARISESGDPIFQDHRALMIRAVAGEGPPAPAIPAASPASGLVTALLIAALGLLGLQRSGP